MRILAFDLGRHTGWAVLDDGTLKTGSYVAKGDDEAAVFIDWSAWASELIYHKEPEAIAFEDVRFNRGRSYIPGMKALLYVKAAHEGLTCFGVDVNTLKAFAREHSMAGTKHWKGSKADMHDALALLRSDEYKGSQVAGMDDNEVDAAWAAIWLDENATEVPDGSR